MEAKKKKFYVVAVAHSPKFQLENHAIYEMPVSRSALDELFESNGVSVDKVAKMLAGKKKKNESSEAYLKRSLEFFDQEWKNAALDSMEYLQGYERKYPKNGSFRWDVRLQKLESRYEKRKPLTRDSLMLRLQAVWSYLIRLPKNALTAKLRKLIKGKKDRDCFHQKDSFFKDEAWMPRALQGGKIYNIDENESIFIHYQNVPLTIEEYMEENNLKLEFYNDYYEFNAMEKNQLIQCWKNFGEIDFNNLFSRETEDAEMNDVGAFDSLVCIKKDENIVAAIWCQKWNETKESNVVDFNNAIGDNTLYVRAFGSVDCKSERLAYLLHLYVISGHQVDNVLCKVPIISNGSPNLCAIADLHEILGYSRTFQREDINAFQYPPIMSSPDISKVFEKESLVIANRKQYISQKAKLMASNISTNFYLFRFYPTHDEMVVSLNILLTLIQSENNNLLNGFSHCTYQHEENKNYELFDCAINDDNESVTLTALEMKALQLINH